jgi:hypothetical protein
VRLEPRLDGADGAPHEVAHGRDGVRAEEAACEVRVVVDPDRVELRDHGHAARELPRRGQVRELVRELDRVDAAPAERAHAFEHVGGVVERRAPPRPQRLRHAQAAHRTAHEVVRRRGDRDELDPVRRRCDLGARHDDLGAPRGGGHAPCST